MDGRTHDVDKVDHSKEKESYDKDFEDTPDFVFLMMFLGIALIFLVYKLIAFIQLDGENLTWTPCYLCCRKVSIHAWVKGDHRTSCIRENSGLLVKHPIAQGLAIRCG